jgi:site-specific recombinase XerD
MKATFKVTFVMQKGKIKADGKAPIIARIIVNGEMAHFSTQQSVVPDHWDSKAGRTDGRTGEEKGINAILAQICAAAQRHYYDLQATGETITALKIKNKICSTEERAIKSTMELFDKFIKEYAEIVESNGYGKEALIRYKICKNRVQEFIHDELGVKDLPLDNITKRLLDRFYIWNRSTYKIGNNTAIHFMHKFSTVYKMAWDNGWVSGNPFHLLKLHKDKTERAYLSIDELERMANKEFSSERLERMRDIFLFCCYTGLSYIDVKTLTTDNLVRKPDGRLWIVTKRTKTEVPVHVPLLEIPLRLIEKYEPLRKGNLVFPVYSNQKSNDYLKEIAALCDIHKDITFHVARHTFATTITLDHGVPIESVSKMLGHTNVQTTQIYARITDRKINSDMAQLSMKIDPLADAFKFPDSEYRAKKDAQRSKELKKFAFENGVLVVPS